ncbi:hypothetical protein EG329_003775 [Mollisiaceae sp. DMI_Dod_QoI]|nr:hypothetical protein EG329_003775 [Helotiales sp. DMI_Dod_QoI]
MPQHPSILRQEYPIRYHSPVQHAQIWGQNKQGPLRRYTPPGTQQPSQVHPPPQQTFLYNNPTPTPTYAPSMRHWTFVPESEGAANARGRGLENCLHEETRNHNETRVHLRTVEGLLTDERARNKYFMSLIPVLEARAADAECRLNKERQYQQNLPAPQRHKPEMLDPVSRLAVALTSLHQSNYEVQNPRDRQHAIDNALGHNPGSILEQDNSVPQVRKLNSRDGVILTRQKGPLSPLSDYKSICSDDGQSQSFKRPLPLFGSQMPAMRKRKLATRKPQIGLTAHSEASFSTPASTAIVELNSAVRSDNSPASSCSLAQSPVTPIAMDTGADRAQVGSVY